MIKLIKGDCLIEMQNLPESSIDAIVTDPPYHLTSIVKRFGKKNSAPAKEGKDGAFKRLSGGFMGKTWDGVDESGMGIAYNVEVWKECLRVLKPGGYLLSFGGTRTYHRMAVAIEDAGFEIRDMVEWIYGSGFPKSHNIGKSVSKIMGEYVKQGTAFKTAGEYGGRNLKDPTPIKDREQFKHKPQTKEAKKYEGWGTALKPAHEPICMARKPLSEKTVAKNVLKHGTGGINIDESRVEPQSEKDLKEIRSERPSKTSNANEYTLNHGGLEGFDRSNRSHITGRFPANLILEDCEEVRECFPDTKSGKIGKSKHNSTSTFVGKLHNDYETNEYGDSGNASHYFKSIIYQPKASKKERNAGCEGLEQKQYSHDGRNKEIENAYQRNKSIATNNHPTVKPIKLLEYLINMVSRKDATIIDPFMGSGTTGIACKNTNRKFIGIEKDADYFKIAENRINKTQNQKYDIKTISKKS